MSRFPALALMVVAVLCAAISLVGINPDAMPWTKADLKVKVSSNKFGLVRYEACVKSICTTDSYDKQACEVGGPFVIATTVLGCLVSFIVLHSIVNANRALIKTLLASIVFLASPVIWLESCHRHIKDSDKFSFFDITLGPGFYVSVAAFAASVLALGFQLVPGSSSRSERKPLLS
eukprot:TRINITY_DN65465_c0_g1_i3.p2 TRINITY_DN65465_c0_g1~~TRINITY_DN65465_c0_g1_i3.p2  ORF type:complete len:176 (-),score=64.60 TRINITY_DN65465_c0_g1_i3:138-665(-)